MGEDLHDLGIAEVITRSKGADIIFSLLDEPKGINEIQAAVGGSSTTIENRVRELIREGYVNEMQKENFPFKRTIVLTQKGELIAHALQSSRKEALRGKLPNERDKWLLTVIYDLKEVNGITRLEKLLFLLKEKLQLSDDKFYTFVPEQFGPYAKDVLDDIYELKKLQLINVQDKTFGNNANGEFIIRWDFTLTDFGNKIASRIFNNLKSDEKKSINEMREYNEMKLAELLSYVHRKYPEFLKK